MNELEQRRRALRHTDPDLHMYIEHITVARILDSFGDQVSGTNKGIANLAWQASRQHKEKADELSGE